MDYTSPNKAELKVKMSHKDSITAGYRHSVGLKSDGTVVAVGRNNDGQCNVSEWHNIVGIAAGDWHTVGLKSDGTVTTVGNNRFLLKIKLLLFY